MDILHIFAGVIALLAGFGALFFRKGQPKHRASGNAFFYSMLVVTATAAYFDISKNELPVMPILTLYLVATSWVTIKRPSQQLGSFEWVAFISIAATTAGLYYLGLGESEFVMSSRGNVPAAFFIVFGSIALLATLLDLLNLLKGGLEGKQRIARHLWRMMVAMTFALMSFLAQDAVIPAVLYETNLTWVPVLFMLASLIFWLGVTLFGRRFAAASDAKPR